MKTRSFLVCCAILFATPHAMARTLDWPSLTVNVQVDEEGVLHITERHAMRFDGDWNGGERAFRLRTWHTLKLESVAELTPEGVEQTPLMPGYLSRVNEYQLRGNVLRWRNRLPTDPPFDNELKIYEIAYTIEGALVADGDGYILDHDLAFPDRPAQIERFDATVEFDPAWQGVESPQTFHREHLGPGESVYIVAHPRYAGAGTPSAVLSEYSIASATGLPMLRRAAVGLTVLGAILMAFLFVWRERTIGRFAPHVSLDRIDEQWLAEHVFKLKPEIVGAAWDRKTSASEVAALIARLTLEGKLGSSVIVRGWGPFKRQVLRLTLACERDAFDTYERALIDRLFFGGRGETDTDLIREHYRTKGFDPAAVISYALKRRASVVFAAQRRRPRKAVWLTAGLLTTGVLLMGAGFLKFPETRLPGVLCVAALVVLWMIGAIWAEQYSSNVHDLKVRLFGALLPPAAICTGVAFVLLGGRVALAWVQILGMTVLSLGALNSVFNRMYSRESDAGLRLRRVLGSARLYFERELASKQPRLKDAWLPYLIAFDLGPRVDRWFRAFGGAAATTSVGRNFGASASASSAASSSSWTGGGGAFGGAGASGSWGAAVAGVAAGVPASSSGGGGGGGGGGSSSSSSSGGGGGGGGSSSGGGGGGGW